MSRPRTTVTRPRVLTKLDLRDRVQVAVLAYETGLVQPGSAEDRPPVGQVP